jgi:DNA-binding MarR family transcriptional regulator
MGQGIKQASLLDADEEAAAGANADAVRSFRLLTFIGQRFRHFFDRRLRSEKLTTQQGFLLTLVRKLDRPTLGQVASAMTTTHQNAKQIAAALERKGMISIVADERDARVRRLEVTPDSRTGWAHRNEDDFSVLGEVFSILSKDEQATLVVLLGRVARSLVERERPPED